jgi:hypothetical protein
MKRADSIQTTVTVDNGLYTAGDTAGGLITFAYAVDENGGAAMVRSIKLAGVAAIAYDLWFMNANLVTPRLNNESFNIVVADELKYLGHVQIAAGNFVKAASAFYVATVADVGLMVQAAAGTQSIYGFLICTAVTAPGTTVLYLTVDFEPL